MRKYFASAPSRLLREESGQTMILGALFLAVLCGVAGFVVDLGHAMVINRQLQAGTEAAASAGGFYLTNSSKTYYSSEGTDYSSSSGDVNAYSTMPQGLGGVTTTVTGYCSSWVATKMAIPCSGSSSGYNAVVVTQTIKVPTYFISVLGIPYVTVSSTALASERGATPVPYNVAIIVDATASMSDTDSDSQCSSTRFACALSGVQTLLQNLAPCPSSMATCNTASTPSTSYSSTSSNGNSNYGAGLTSPQEDDVALFAFPNMKISTIPDYWGCSGTSPTPLVYSFPSSTISTSSSYSGTTVATNTVASYMVSGYTSDYKTKPASSTLNNSSDIVKAVGAASGCTGMSNPGGEGTYYAGVIYAAAASLMAQQKTYPNTQNAMVIISDGESSATYSHMYNCASGTSCYSGTAYPGNLDQCNQAVLAGKAATTAGITVYAVSYGSEASACMTGNQAQTTQETAAQTGYTAGITPCQTMKGIASNTGTFYSDYTQSGSGVDSSCIGTATSTTNLKNIFTDITYNFTTSRLLAAPSGCNASNASAANCDPTTQSN